ncbi:MAG: hypothetical protein MI919_15130, partial [Holophagales bacterium]|nr:hypothetical protein [Holophagales bacterium]
MPRNKAGRSHLTGPPVLAILFLVVFSTLVLTFVTLRQVHSSERHCLRLLAGFSQRAEASIEDLTDRFVRIASTEPIESSQDPDAGRPGGQGAGRIGSLLANFQNIDLLEPPARLGEGERGRKRSILEHQLSDGKLYLTYAGPRLSAGQAVERPSAQEEGDPEGEKPVDGIEGESHPAADPEDEGGRESRLEEGARRVRAALDLESALAPMILPGIFDALLVADEAGTVIFRSGDPELVISRVEQIRGETGQLVSLASGLPRKEVVQLAGRRFVYFSQPITLHLAPARKVPPDEVRLTAFGLVAEDRMLSASLASSPLLLLGLVSVFPLGLLAWPILKLWLISPRQRFSRVDVAFLLSSSVVGLSLLTLFLFSVCFHYELRQVTDDQLRRLSRAVHGSFVRELAEIRSQLDTLGSADQQGRWFDEVMRQSGTKALRDWDREAEGRVFAHLETLRRLVRRGRPAVVDLSPYPFFRAAFWMNRDGTEWAKLPLSRFSANPSTVSGREYFQCAAQNRPYRIPCWSRDGSYRCGSEAVGRKRTSEPGAIRGAVRQGRHEGESRGRAVTDEKVAELSLWEGETGHPRESIALCLQSILSNVSGTALAAASIPLSHHQNVLKAREEEAGELVGLALVTELRSIHRQALPTGTSIAVVGPRGQVQFHSEPSRNLTENLLKSTGDDAKLRAVLADRRTALLDANYLGLDHRLHVSPIEGLPWSLTMLRDKKDLRQRTFEMVLDFFNPFLVLMGILHLLLILVIVVSRLNRFERTERLFERLWPTSDRRSTYRNVVTLSPSVFGLVALAVVEPRSWPVVLPSIAGAIVLVLAPLFRRMERHDSSSSAPGGSASERQARESEEPKRFRFYEGWNRLRFVAAVLIWSAVFASVLRYRLSPWPSGLPFAEVVHIATGLAALAVVALVLVCGL